MAAKPSEYKIKYWGRVYILPSVIIQLDWTYGFLVLQHQLSKIPRCLHEAGINQRTSPLCTIDDTGPYWYQDVLEGNEPFREGV